MSAALKPGMRVQWVDEPLEGIIAGISEGEIRIRTSDGMELTATSGEVIPIPDPIYFPVPPSAASHKAPVRKKGPSAGISRKDKGPPPLEVDLHMEKLLTPGQRRDAMEILDFQVDTARRQLEFALRKRIQRLVFIHGEGRGILREELHTLLRRYPGIRFEDGDPRRYGAGATAVYIPQELFV